MPTLLARGNETRLTIVRKLLEKPNSTEEELEASTNLSKSTVRAVLARLDQAGLAVSERARVPGKRGPGPLAYRIRDGLADPESVMERLHQWAETTLVKDLTTAPPATPAGPAMSAHGEPNARAEHLFVVAKAGTNDVMLTKDGRMLLVEKAAKDRVLQRCRSILKGEELETMSLAEFRRRFPH